MGSFVEHAKIEFVAAGYKPLEDYAEDDPDRWIQENVLELLEAFSKQGHSGSSAPYVVSVFSKLARFEPLAPITGEDWEWSAISAYGGGDDVYQNKRCSAIFKQKSSESYYIDAICWKNPAGVTYSGHAMLADGTYISSRQYITFPFTPKTFYIDVLEEEVTKDNWIFHVKDAKQLDKVFEYYVDKRGL